MNYLKCILAKQLNFTKILSLAQIPISYYVIPELKEEHTQKSKIHAFIVCHDYDLSDENKALLENILKAIKLEAKDFYLCCLKENERLESRKAVAMTHAKYLISFGVHPKFIGMNINPSLYKTMHFNQYSVLFSDLLVVLQKDKSKKTILWKALQECIPQN